MSHDIFRYVPQIEQLGLDLPANLVARLAERDRQLEDYLSNLHPNAGGSSSPLGIFQYFKVAGDVPSNTVSPVAGWSEYIASGVGAEVVPPGNYVRTTQAGVYIVSADLLTSSQSQDFFIAMMPTNLPGVQNSYQRSINEPPTVGSHLTVARPGWPRVYAPNTTLDLRFWHNNSAFPLSAELALYVTLLGPVP